MAVAPGTKIELADMLTLGALAQTKTGVSIAGGYHFIGRTNEVDHAVEGPSVAGWLNLDHLDRAGLLIGDVVVNTRFPNAIQSSKGWRLTGYPWNDPTKWVNAQYRVGTFTEMHTAPPPTNGVRFWTTDFQQLYIRRNNDWILFGGWRTELLEIQTKLKTHAKFNFLDPAQTSTFVGYARAAIVSDRVLCDNPWFTSGAGRPIRQADYDNAGSFPPDVAEVPSNARNDVNSLGDDALERELLHYGGAGAGWKLEMVPQLSHLGGLTGFRLMGAGGRVKARLTNIVDALGNRIFPGLTSVTRSGAVGPPTVGVSLTGSMAGIATHYLDIQPAFGNPNLYVVGFHVYINGDMAPGTCTIGADLTLSPGWTWDQAPTAAFKTMAVPGQGAAYPLWVDVDLANASQEHAAIAVDGRPIYTTGILRDDILCLHLPGYSPPGFPQRTTERCDRFAYYSPNSAVLKPVDNDAFPSIGKRVPVGVIGDKGFYPGYNAPSVVPEDEDTATVDVAVNDRGAPGTGGLCKTIPFVKHSLTATAPRWTTDVPVQFALVEVVVQRRPVLVGEFHVMPTLPDHPTLALTVQIGWYAVGEDGQFQSTGINIDLAANVNVGRWRGLLPIKTDRALVYDSSEGVTVTALTADWSGTVIRTAEQVPMRAAYHIETMRLLHAI